MALSMPIPTQLVIKMTTYTCRCYANFAGQTVSKSVYIYTKITKSRVYNGHLLALPTNQKVENLT